MAKITPTSLVAAISGRTCQNDSTHFQTNRQTGRVFAVKVCNPCDGSDPTAAQQQVRTAFTQMQAIAKAWRVANAPSDTQPKGSAEFQAMMRQYKAQHKIGNWLAFVRTKIQDGAVPSFLATDGTSSGSTPTTPSGNTQQGGSTPSGGTDDNPTFG